MPYRAREYKKPSSWTGRIIIAVSVILASVTFYLPMALTLSRVAKYLWHHVF
jgi:hypothetical protein